MMNDLPHSEYQRKRLQSESKEERDARVVTLTANQKTRLQMESKEERDDRLATL